MNKQPMRMFQSEQCVSPCGFTKEATVEEYDDYTRIYKYKCGCIMEENFYEGKNTLCRTERELTLPEAIIKLTIDNRLYYATFNGIESIKGRGRSSAEAIGNLIIEYNK